jgi:hypothetical protein
MTEEREFRLNQLKWICVTIAICVILHGLFNRFEVVGTEGVNAYQYDKLTGEVWQIYAGGRFDVEDKKRE